ncbi:restriction endonuclease subunit S [Paenibacillus sp. FSL R10-2782]|uniref:restriction endonuclease subunit S n=1 Tax=Paenibacillus sp. FSL R10-2782 TaxID=2954661 RepID=UPI0031599522
MSDKIKKMPEIRFAGFTDAWEQRKLGEIYTERNERGNNSLQILSVSIHHGISNGELDSSSLGKKVRRSEDKSLYKGVRSGDLVFNMMRAWQGAIGVAKIEGMVSPAYITAIPNEKLFPPFMDYCLRRHEIITQIDNFSYGVTDFRKRLYWDSFSKVSCLIPSVPEQIKINSFFNQLDNLITLHQRKLELLKDTKKGLLQKMFPKDGAGVPEIRFAGFTDAWEQRKLSDVLTERNVQHPQNKNYPLVSFTVEKGVTPKTERYEREQLVVGDKAAKKYKATELNDIVYNPANLKFGAISRNSYGKAVFSPIYVTFEVNDKLAFPSYVEMFVTRQDFIRYSLRYQQGTVYERQSVSPEDLLSLKILLPGKEEQLQIGNFFEQLNVTIALQKRELNSLENLKKSLLQQMFI